MSMKTCILFKFHKYLFLWPYVCDSLSDFGAPIAPKTPHLRLSAPLNRRKLVSETTSSFNFNFLFLIALTYMNSMRVLYVAVVGMCWLIVYLCEYSRLP